MPTINSKAISRLAAIQTIYKILLSNSTSPYDNLSDYDISNLIDSTKNYYKKDVIAEDLGIESEKKLKVKINVKFLEDLIRFSIENIKTIIVKIEENMSNSGEFSNMHITLQAVLIVAFCEIIYFPEIPSKVVISEYTDISADIVQKKEIAFVNSILDNSAKIIRNEI